jgi:hypothetical protein
MGKLKVIRPTKIQTFRSRINAIKAARGGRR